MSKRMDKAEAQEHGDRIRKMYDDYTEFRTARRAEVMARVEAELAAELDARFADVSREVRRVYELGVPKGVLREATRAYTNTASWSKVWNAGADVLPVVERGTKALDKVSPFTLVYDDPKDAKEKYVEAGKKAALVVRSGPDGVAWDEPLEIPLEKKSLTGPWIPDPQLSSWYDIEPETGDRYLAPMYQQLSVWGADDAEAIQTIEKAISDARKGK